ncbi:MAG: response regulator [Bacteroidetes bacterium]|nr:response regulator [Bacteroidota bacterium]
MESILVVDDEISLCSILKEELTEVGYDVDFVDNGNDAIEYLSTNPVQLVLLDLKMPGKNGFDVLEEMNQKNISSQVIILTAYADIKSAIHSAKLGVTDFISKPYNFDELLIAIQKALHK